MTLHCPHCNAEIQPASPAPATCPACGNALPVTDKRASSKLPWILPLAIAVVLAAGLVVYFRMAPPAEPTAQEREAFEQSMLSSCVSSASAGVAADKVAEMTPVIQAYCQCTLDEFNKTLVAKNWTLGTLLPSLGGDISANPELETEMKRIGEFCSKQVQAPAAQ